MAGYTADAFFKPRQEMAAILSNVGTGTWVSADVLGEFAAVMLSTFAGVAGILAVIGVYGSRTRVCSRRRPVP